MADEMHVGMAAATPQMSPIARLFNIFHAPRSVFESLLNAKWAWIVPLALGIVITAAFVQITTPYTVEEQIENFRNSPWFDNIPKAQQDEAIANFRNPPGWQVALKYVGIVIVVIVLAMLIGLLMLLIGNVFLGGDAKFWQYLNVYNFAGLVSIPGMILKTPLIMAKESMDVRTSLAILLPADDTSSFLYHLFGWTDIFAIWMLVLLIIGTKVILPKVSVGSITTAFVISYAVLALALSALASTIGSFFM